jgi:hypothetical protein
MNSIPPTALGPSLPAGSRALLQAEQSWIWKSAFGDVLIEVRAGRVFVNGELVVPASGGAIAESTVQR